MNRFMKTTAISGIAALAAVAAVTVPALARSHSSEEHGRAAMDRAHMGDPGPSGASDPLVADGKTYGATNHGSWPMVAAPSDAAAIDQQIRHLPAGRFNISHVDLTGLNRTAGVISDRAREPHYLANLHRSIDANRPLLARLERQNVEIRNVIGAEPGGDGSMTFYVQ